MATTKISNAQLWDQYKQSYPEFAKFTSKSTAEVFTDKGFEEMKATDPKGLIDFFNISIQTAFIGFRVATVTNPFEQADFGEHYEAPFGGVIQRMAVMPLKPISPKFKGLKNGDSVDMFKVRIPEVKERFYQQNFDYQNYVTIKDESFLKPAFVREYGMQELIGNIMLALNQSYTKQQYLNQIEAINKGILNATVHPLKDSQKVGVTLTDGAYTDTELRDFILKVTNAVTAMKLAPCTDAYNAASFETSQDVSRLRLLVRPGIKSAIENIPALNKPGLGLPVEVIEVANFGGLEYYSDSAFTKKLYHRYDDDGVEIGFTETEGGTTAYTGDVYVKDTNEKTVALLADKGIIFTCEQNPMRVAPTMHNEAGLYVDYWASCYNNTIAVDATYNAIVFNKA